MVDRNADNPSTIRPIVTNIASGRTDRNPVHQEGSSKAINARSWIYADKHRRIGEPGKDCLHRRLPRLVETHRRKPAKCSGSCRHPHSPHCHHRRLYLSRLPSPQVLRRQSLLQSSSSTCATVAAFVVGLPVRRQREPFHAEVIGRLVAIIAVMLASPASRSRRRCPSPQLAATQLTKQPSRLLLLPSSQALSRHRQGLISPQTSSPQRGRSTVVAAAIGVHPVAIVTGFIIGILRLTRRSTHAACRSPAVATGTARLHCRRRSGPRRPRCDPGEPPRRHNGQRTVIATGVCIHIIAIITALKALGSQGETRLGDAIAAARLFTGVATSIFIHPTVPSSQASAPFARARSMRMTPSPHRPADNCCDRHLRPLSLPSSQAS